MSKERRTQGIVLAPLIAAALLFAVLAAPAQAAVTHFHATVLSKNAKTRSFQARTSSGKTIRIKVTANTKFERIQGRFSGLRAGQQIEVDARRTDNGLIATQVETSGGDDNGGDDDGGRHGGNDDGPNHT